MGMGLPPPPEIKRLCIQDKIYKSIYIVHTTTPWSVPVDCDGCVLVHMMCILIAV